MFFAGQRVRHVNSNRLVKVLGCQPSMFCVLDYYGVFDTVWLCLAACLFQGQGTVLK